MHNFGLNQHEQNKTTDTPWQNNIANLQKQIQQQQQLNNSLAHLQSSQQQQQQQQQHASHSPMSPATSQSTIPSRFDQIIRTTLHDSVHMPKSTSNSNNMPSSPAHSLASSITFNPSSSLSSSTAPHNFSVSSGVSNIGSGLLSNTSPLTSFYDNNISSVNTLNNNNSSLTGNASGSTNTKVSARSDCHSAFAAAAALQSLNQSHLQRSHQLAQMQQSTRPPPNPLMNAGIHGNNLNMPKLPGITSSTSSDHPNHNHLAFSSNHPNLESVELSRLVQQQLLQQQQHQKLPPGVRNPNSWQDQVNLNPSQGWPYGNPYTTGFPSSAFPTSSSSLTTSAVSNMSNSNNMIGQEGDNNSIPLRHKPPLPPTSSALPNQPPGSAMPNLSKQYQWLENTRGQNSALDVSKSHLQPQSQPTCQDLMDDKSAMERLGLFTMNLLNPCIPGTSKHKRVITQDSVDDLRQSIYRGEFYTKFEEIAVGILTNQVYVPEFSIIDYIRRDKFSLQELEKIDSVHKRCGILTSILMNELAHQRPYPPLFKGNDTKLPHSDTLNNLNLASGSYQPHHSGFNNQIPDLKNNTFLPPPAKSESNHFPMVEKNRRSSQSPSDILSRSQPNNGPAPRILNAHSSAPHNFTNSSLPTSNHLPPPPPPPSSVMNQPRGQHSTYARSSPFQPMAPQNLVSSHRPQRPSSTTSLGVSHEPPMNMTSPMIRQPPAAHQSSARPILSGSNPNLSQAHSSSSSSGPPISAHMSSKTPQTPRLQAQETVFPSKTTVSDIITTDKHPNKNFTLNSLPNQPNFPPSLKSDIDPTTGLPVQTHLNVKQQELLNREMNLKRTNTPQFVSNSNNNNINSNNQPNFQQHNLDISRSPRGFDLQQGSRSPMTHHLQSMYLGGSTNPTNNSAMYKGSPMSTFAGSNPSMPPPHSDFHRGPNPSDLSRLNELRPPLMTSTGNHLSPANESQLRHYSAIVSAYQQQQQNHLPTQQQQHLLMTNKNSPNLDPPTTSLPYGMNHSNIYGNLQPPMSSPQSGNDGIHLDIQNHAYHETRPNSQQSSPKQNKQRSIITGSASAAPKRAKKIKHSPPNPQQNDVKLPQSTLNGAAIGGQQTTPNPNLADPTKNPQLPSIQQENNPYQFDDKELSPPLHNMESSDSPLTSNMGDSRRCLSSNNGQKVSSEPLKDSHATSLPQTCLPPTRPRSAAATDKNVPSCLSASETVSTCSTKNEVSSATNLVTSNEIPKLDSIVTPDIKPIISTIKIENNSTSTNQNQEPTIANQNSKLSESLEKVQHVTTNNAVINSSAIAEKSKYQKLYTKKAWLKNYDQEDQERTKTTSDQNSDFVKMVDADVKSEIKSEDNSSLNTTAKLDSSKSSDIKVADSKSTKPKSSSKKKIKEESSKKPVPAKAQAKGVENISEPSGASSSENDSDDTSSLKSSGDKKLRRTPRRKAKPSSDKEQLSPKSTLPSIKRGKKVEKEEPSKKRKQNDEQSQNPTRSSKKSKLATKTSGSKSKQEQKVLRRQGGRASVTKMDGPDDNEQKSVDSKPTLKNPKQKSDQADSKSSGSQSDNETVYSSNESDVGSLPSDDIQGSTSLKSKKGSTAESKRNNASNKSRQSKSKQDSVKANAPDDDDDDDSSASAVTEAPKLKSAKKIKKAKRPPVQSLSPATADNSAATTEDDEEEEMQKAELDKLYKRTGQKFLQKDPCYEIVPKSVRCLECRRVRTSNIKSDKTSKHSGANWDDFCRFYEFRKLRYNKTEQITVAGFSDLHDARDDDKHLWMPYGDKHPSYMTYKSAQFILSNAGTEFCKLVLQERSARERYDAKRGEEQIITWKRAVNGLRELCDVCATTLFNCHYVCERCGFVVCLDCHQNRAKKLSQDEKLDLKVKVEGQSADKSSPLSKMSVELTENSRNETPDQQVPPPSTKKNKRDRFGWIFCAKNEEHAHDKLILTQIIAGDCLEEVSKQMHEVRARLKLGFCSCEKERLQMTNKIFGHLDQHENTSDDPKLKMEEEIKTEDVNGNSESSHSTLKGLLLASNLSNNSDVKDSEDQVSASQDAKNKETKSEDTIEKNNKDTMSEIKFDFWKEDDSQEDTKLSQQVTAAIEGCISSLPTLSADNNQTTNSLKDNLDKGIFSKEIKTESEETSQVYSWLCGGELLVLLQPNHEKNIELFRKQWRRGKPVLVRGVDQSMDMNKWLPQWFGKEFGEYRSDLVDCRNGDIHRHSMKKYWEGFEPTNPSTKKKAKDDAVPLLLPTANNEECSNGPSYYSGSALWRLKDWPPGQDFNEILPEHYDDFMDHLPLSKYTTRYGKLNLSCRLPKCMLKPDLGPKMYSAYGTSKFPERGTTNLHLDISDAINVMVYVSGAKAYKNGSKEAQDIYSKTVEECSISQDMKEQIKNKSYIPGALWHIFEPKDAKKMRDFLNKVSDERNISPEKRTDPIHDQTWYLDQTLLDRLEKEYGVQSYPILQCMGDAILIPAGAPHQVKNLQNCIKVANDFVSPENVKYCLQLTNEFRSLPDTHINQEDKLQIKNILYHSIKDSLHYIRMFENNEITQD